MQSDRIAYQPDTERINLPRRPSVLASRMNFICPTLTRSGFYIQICSVEYTHHMEIRAFITTYNKDAEFFNHLLVIYLRDVFYICGL